jgi:hypothetical protein
MTAIYADVVKEATVAADALLPGAELCRPFPGLPPRRNRWWSHRVVPIAFCLVWIGPAVAMATSKPTTWSEGLAVGVGTLVGIAASSLFAAKTPVQRLEARLPPTGHAAVLAYTAADESRLRDELRQTHVDLRELDGSRITSLADLASELDAALGPFAHPSEPAAKIAAHIGHESRGTGERALLWRDAHQLWAHDQAAFSRFVADWDRAMHRKGAVRLLFVDLGRPAV